MSVWDSDFVMENNKRNEPETDEEILMDEYEKGDGDDLANWWFNWVIDDADKLKITEAKTPRVTSTEDGWEEFPQNQDISSESSCSLPLSSTSSTESYCKLAAYNISKNMSLEQNTSEGTREGTRADRNFSHNLVKKSKSYTEAYSSRHNPFNSLLIHPPVRRLTKSLSNGQLTKQNGSYSIQKNTKKCVDHMTEDLLCDTLKCMGQENRNVADVQTSGDHHQNTYIPPPSSINQYLVKQYFSELNRHTHSKVVQELQRIHSEIIEHDDDKTQRQESNNEFVNKIVSEKLLLEFTEAINKSCDSKLRTIHVCNLEVDSKHKRTDRQTMGNSFKDSIYALTTLFDAKSEHLNKLGNATITDIIAMPATFQLIDFDSDEGNERPPKAGNISVQEHKNPTVSSTTQLPRLTNKIRVSASDSKERDKANNVISVNFGNPNTIPKTSEAKQNKYIEETKESMKKERNGTHKIEISSGLTNRPAVDQETRHSDKSHVSTEAVSSPNLPENTELTNPTVNTRQSEIEEDLHRQRRTHEMNGNIQNDERISKNSPSETVNDSSNEPPSSTIAGIPVSEKLVDPQLTSQSNARRDLAPNHSSSIEIQVLPTRKVRKINDTIEIAMTKPETKAGITTSASIPKGRKKIIQSNNEVNNISVVSLTERNRTFVTGENTTENNSEISESANQTEHLAPILVSPFSNEADDSSVSKQTIPTEEATSIWSTGVKEDFNIPKSRYRGKWNFRSETPILQDQYTYRSTPFRQRLVKTMRKLDCRDTNLVDQQAYSSNNLTSRDSDSPNINNQTGSQPAMVESTAASVSSSMKAYIIPKIRTEVPRTNIIHVKLPMVKEEDLSRSILKAERQNSPRTSIIHVDIPNVKDETVSTNPGNGENSFRTGVNIPVANDEDLFTSPVINTLNDSHNSLPTDVIDIPNVKDETVFTNPRNGEVLDVRGFNQKTFGTRAIIPKVKDETLATSPRNRTISGSHNSHRTSRIHVDIPMVNDEGPPPRTRIHVDIPNVKNETVSTNSRNGEVADNKNSFRTGVNIPVAKDEYLSTSPVINTVADSHNTPLTGIHRNIPVAKDESLSPGSSISSVVDTQGSSRNDVNNAEMKDEALSKFPLLNTVPGTHTVQDDNTKVKTTPNVKLSENSLSRTMSNTSIESEWPELKEVQKDIGLILKNLLKSLHRSKPPELSGTIRHPHPSSSQEDWSEQKNNNKDIEMKPVKDNITELHQSEPSGTTRRRHNSSQVDRNEHKNINDTEKKPIKDNITVRKIKQPTWTNCDRSRNKQNNINIKIDIDGRTRSEDYVFKPKEEERTRDIDRSMMSSGKKSTDVMPGKKQAKLDHNKETHTSNKKPNNLSDEKEKEFTHRQSTVPEQDYINLVKTDVNSVHFNEGNAGESYKTQSGVIVSKEKRSTYIPHSETKNVPFDAVNPPPFVPQSKPRNGMKSERKKQEQLAGRRKILPAKSEKPSHRLKRDGEATYVRNTRHSSKNINKKHSNSPKQDEQLSLWDRMIETITRSTRAASKPSVTRHSSNKTNKSTTKKNEKRYLDKNPRYTKDARVELRKKQASGIASPLSQLNLHVKRIFSAENTGTNKPQDSHTRESLKQRNSPIYSNINREMGNTTISHLPIKKHKKNVKLKESNINSTFSKIEKQDWVTELTSKPSAQEIEIRAIIKKMQGNNSNSLGQDNRLTSNKNTPSAEEVSNTKGQSKHDHVSDFNLSMNSIPIMCQTASWVSSLLDNPHSSEFTVGPESKKMVSKIGDVVDEQQSVIGFNYDLSLKTCGNHTEREILTNASLIQKYIDTIVRVISSGRNKSEQSAQNAELDSIIQIFSESLVKFVDTSVNCIDYEYSTIVDDMPDCVEEKMNHRDSDRRESNATPTNSISHIQETSPPNQKLDQSLQTLVNYLHEIDKNNSNGDNLSKKFIFRDARENRLKRSNAVPTRNVLLEGIISAHQNDDGLFDSFSVSTYDNEISVKRSASGNLRKVCLFGEDVLLRKSHEDQIPIKHSKHSHFEAFLPGQDQVTESNFPDQEIVTESLFPDPESSIKALCLEVLRPVLESSTKSLCLDLFPDQGRVLDKFRVTRTVSDQSCENSCDVRMNETDFPSLTNEDKIHDLTKVYLDFNIKQDNDKANGKATNGSTGFSLRMIEPVTISDVKAFSEADKKEVEVDDPHTSDVLSTCPSSVPSTTKSYRIKADFADSNNFTESNIVQIKNISPVIKKKPLQTIDIMVMKVKNTDFNGTLQQ